MNIDLEELERELSEMKHWQPLFRVVKREMVKRGHWKNKPRGKPTIENLKHK